MVHTVSVSEKDGLPIQGKRTALYKEPLEPLQTPMSIKNIIPFVYEEELFSIY